MTNRPLTPSQNRISIHATTKTSEQPMSSSTATPRDYRQEVTDTIIRLLEQGTTPWQKPWDATGSVSMPMNPTTGKAYRGGNALYLMTLGMMRGYSDPRWMTYKQAAENNWQVRRGEKGTQIEFWDVKPVIGEMPDANAPEPTSPEKRETRLIHKVYTVFHASQIDDIPAFAPKVFTSFEAIEAGENILKYSGAVILHDQTNRAFYRRTSDEIHLPNRDFFPEAAGYYGTALHELAHWTGHPDRLNRSTLNESYSFGDTNYAKEELRAELASIFLAAERGIPHQPERHAAYVASWIKALKDDKNEIFRAASDAAKAADYILAFERGKDKAQTTPEIVEPVTQPPAPLTHAERVQKERTLTLDLDFGIG